MNDDPDVCSELERLQSNIATLFKSVISDREKYKQERDKSTASVDSLILEIIILRKENEQLRKCKKLTKNSCMKCTELKEQLMMQDIRAKKLEKSLEVLREKLCIMPNKDGNPNFSHLLPRILDKMTNESLTNTGNICKSKEDDELSIFDTFCEKGDQSSHLADHVNNEEKINHDKPATANNVEESSLDSPSSRTGPSAGYELMDVEFRTPKKGDQSEFDFISSPSCVAERIKKGEKSPILVDQRLLFNKNAIPGSPSTLKRKASDTVSISPGKLSNQTLFMKSPKLKKFKSPVKGSRMKLVSQLKSTNSIEAEISLAGIRKLKQTQLNPDYYKSKSQNGGGISGSKANDKLNDENKFSEDDIILESPKPSLNFYDDFKKLKEEELEEDTIESAMRDCQQEAFDPEETFVSSSFIRNNLKDSKKPEHENPVPYSERSPEYNTVPYPYKGSPVRKKAERMRLPGQTCVECNKYYKAILGEIDPEKLQEILNQCSRHRDQHYNIVDTPPGYWKPYLTATINDSPEDDDTQLNE